jgi:hypothetical protein
MQIYSELEHFSLLDESKMKCGVVSRSYDVTRMVLVANIISCHLLELLRAA